MARGGYQCISGVGLHVVTIASVIQFLSMTRRFDDASQ